MTESVESSLDGVPRDEDGFDLDIDQQQQQQQQLQTVLPSMSPREIEADRRLRLREAALKAIQEQNHEITMHDVGLAYKAVGKAAAFIFQSLTNKFSFGAVPAPKCPEGTSRTSGSELCLPN